MRHYVVTTKLARHARAALDEEAARRPVRNPEPQPPQEPPRSRLASVVGRVRALAARALRRPRSLSPRTDPR
jgi:predicted secreted protein